MAYVAPYLWLDPEDAEQSERIGEHEAYFTLFDLANNRYLGNRMHWAEALKPFLTEELREVVGTRFRVVPRCHCDSDPMRYQPDPLRYQSEEWAGSRQEISFDQHGIINFDATQDAAAAEWRAHVDQLRAELAARQAAAARRTTVLLAVDEIDALDPMNRFGAIRAARAALDDVEVNAVVAARREGKSWTEIADQLGMARQSAWERFAKHCPQGAEAA